MVIFYNFVMFEENIEQFYAIKFCVKLNKFATETFESLTKAYEDATLLKTMILKYHKAFTKDRGNIQKKFNFGKIISSTKDRNLEMM